MHDLRIVALGVALAFVAAACGGGGGSGKTSTAGVTPAGTAGPPARGAQTPTSGEATAIAAQYPLETYRHEAAPLRQGSDVIDFPFDISFPRGWIVENTGIAVTASLPSTGIYPYASISADCRPGVDKSQMIAADADEAERGNFGNLGSVPRSSLQVGGRDAIRADWVGSAVVLADHISVYVNGKDCAWRLQLNTYGAIQSRDLEALFLRVVDAFNPDQGLP